MPGGSGSIRGTRDDGGHGWFVGDGKDTVHVLWKEAVLVMRRWSDGETRVVNIGDVLVNDQLFLLST